MTKEDWNTVALAICAIGFIALMIWRLGVLCG